jgi:hypothetical protein
MRFIAHMAFAGAVAVFATAAVAQSGDWLTYRNARFGYMISYPIDLFEEEPANDSEDGRLVSSRDGKAKLLIGAFENEERVSLADYRTFLKDRNYPGATIDYAPVRDRWFVLSGVRDGTVFYERVTFTCGGRLINSWALLYPEADKKRFDPIVARLAKSYSAGAGPKGDCE